MKPRNMQLNLRLFSLAVSPVLDVVPIDPDYTFQFVKDSVVENKAWVTCFDAHSQTKRKDVVTLVKIDGSWKVHVEH